MSYNPDQPRDAKGEWGSGGKTAEADKKLDLAAIHADIEERMAREVSGKGRDWVTAVAANDPKFQRHRHGGREGREESEVIFDAARAIAAANELPAVKRDPRPGATPFPAAAFRMSPFWDPEVDWLALQEELHARSRGFAVAYKLQLVDLAKLKTAQPHVKLQTVLDYIAITRDAHYAGTVLRYKGHDWIADGNHRLTARHLGGVTAALVQYFDLDAHSCIAPQTWSL